MVYMSESDASDNLPMFVEVGKSIFRIDDVVLIRLSPDARSEAFKVDIFTESSVHLNQPYLSLLMDTKEELQQLLGALFYLHQRFIRNTFGIEEYDEEEIEQIDELTGEFAKDRGVKNTKGPVEEDEEDEEEDEDAREYDDDEMDEEDDDDDEDDLEDMDEDDMKILDFVPLGNVGFVRLSHIRGLIQLKTAPSNKNVSNKKYELLVSLKSDAPPVHIAMNTKEAKSLSEFLSYFCLSATDEAEPSDDDDESLK